jgi:hypothetical protein
VDLKEGYDVGGDFAFGNPLELEPIYTHLPPKWPSFSTFHLQWRFCPSLDYSLVAQLAGLRWFLGFAAASHPPTWDLFVLVPSFFSAVIPCDFNPNSR